MSHFYLAADCAVIGIEHDPLRVMVATEGLESLYRECNTGSCSEERVPKILHILGDINEIKTLESFNLVYCFDSVFTPATLSHISTLLKSSSSVTHLVSCRSISGEIIDKYGYNVEPMHDKDGGVIYFKVE